MIPGDTFGLWRTGFLCPLRTVLSAARRSPTDDDLTAGPRTPPYNTTVL